MGVIISRIKENQKINTIKEKNTLKPYQQKNSKNCLKMLRRDKRAEKIYKEIRQKDYEDNSIEV